MKKTLLAVVAALAMVSCSQNEIDGIDNGKQDARNEIKFGYSVVGRATVTTTTTLEHFKVNAYSHSEASYAANITTSDLMSNIQFDKDTESKWSAAGDAKYYWPTTGSVTFFGYSPTTIANENYTKTEKNSPVLTYTVADNITNQEDVLITKLTKAVTTKKDAVALSFSHALTQIIFKVKGEDANVSYDVKSITIKGIKNKGTYDYTTEKWTLAGDAATKDYTITLTDTKFNGEEEARPLEGADQIMICMPQDASSITVEVSYTATLNTVEVHNADDKVIKTLNDTWEKGNKIAYTLLLSGDKMTISGGTVDEDWSTKTSTEGTFK